MYNNRKVYRKFILLTLCCIIFCTACSNTSVKLTENDQTATEEKTETLNGFLNIEITEKHESYYNKESKNSFNYTYELLNLSEESAKNFPELNKAINEFTNNLDNDNITEFEENRKMLEETSEESFETDKEYFHIEDIYIRRADPKVLSFIIDGYTYMGGAHGLPFCVGKNFDSVSGKKLSLLGDVIKDKKAFADIIKTRLNEKRGEQANPEFDMEEHLDNVGENISWTLDYDGVTVIFGAYEVASYAEGMPAIKVLFAENPELFNEKYVSEISEYAVELNTSTDFDMDVTGDGKLDIIRCSSVSDGYDFYKYKININDESFLDDDAYAFEYRTILIHRGSRNYLFVESTSENDRNCIRIYDITNGEISLESEMPKGFFWSYESKQICRTAITNPYEIYLGRRTDLLSTVTVYRIYNIGEDGSLTPVEEISITDTPVTLTLLQDVDVEVYDEKSKKTTKKETLEKGTELVLYGVDEEDYAYLKLDDTQIVRIKVNTDEGWPHTIEGTEIEEIFEGMFFAG